jgi:hypothetical protein
MDRHMRVALAGACRLGGVDRHSRVGDHRAARVREHRVEVHFLQPGQQASHARDAAEQRAERVEVGGGHAAIAVEQAVHARARHQLARQRRVERRQGDGGIAHRFDGDAAGAERDHRPNTGSVATPTRTSR